MPVQPRNTGHPAVTEVGGTVSGAVPVRMHFGVEVGRISQRLGVGPAVVGAVRKGGGRRNRPHRGTLERDRRRGTAAVASEPLAVVAVAAPFHMGWIAFENRPRTDGQVFRVAVIRAEQRAGRQVEVFGVEFLAQPVVPGARHPGTDGVGHEKVVVIVGSTVGLRCRSVSGCRGI